MPEKRRRRLFSEKRVERAGLIGFGFSLGIRRLVKSGFIEIREDTNHNGAQLDAIFLTENAWAWIEANEDLFKVHQRKAAPPPPSDTITDDDVPIKP
jgi:hypothetical protein